MSTAIYVTLANTRTWFGYNVRVPGTPRRLFSVRVLGAGAARRQAIRYRDACVELLGFKSAKAMMKSRAPKNPSGIIGVRLVRGTARYRYKGVEYEYETVHWVACWKVNGKRVKRYFSVQKYGKRKSKALAVAARQKRA